VAMVNEVLCKLLCHNLCCLIQEQCELGIEPIFWPQHKATEPKEDPMAAPVTMARPLVRPVVQAVPLALPAPDPWASEHVQATLWE
jgi:hypothetical protein